MSAQIKFPEIIRPHAACRLCCLRTTHPTVLWTAHELYRKGLDDRPLVGRLESVFAEIGEPPPSRGALHRHFENHCAILREAKKVDDDAEDYETDYLELRKLYDDFRDIFGQVKREFQAKAGEPGAKKTTDYGLVMLVKLAGELRQMLKTLADMRNDEKLFSVVLVRHTEQILQQVAEPIAQALRNIREQASNGNANEATESVDRLLETELLAVFDAAGRQAIEHSKQQFKLH